MAREMKDSGIKWIGEIPIDWKCVRLKHFYEFEKGKMQLNILKNILDYIMEIIQCIVGKQKIME